MSVTKLFRRLKLVALDQSPRPYAVWSLMAIVVVGLVFGGVLGSAWFLYQYVYLTVISKNQVLILNAEAHVQPLDTAHYRQFKKVLELKSQKLPLSLEQHNVFVYGPIASSTVSSPSAP